jgi:hypothetical protein
MKTADFIQAVRKFGWELERTTKHANFTNRLFRANRPVAMSLNIFRSKMTPEDVENTAKCMGLRWKDMDPEPFPRQNSPYYPEYQRLGMVRL